MLDRSERRLRVLILTHHYPPEVGAPQTRLSGTAAFLASRGHDVRVLTALPSYPTGIIPPSYRGRLTVREAIDGIPVYRTWTYARQGSSTRLRLANQLSFTVSALAALPLVGRPDVILVESPPLFLGATGGLLALALRAPMVLHVSDLWPEVAIQLGALSHPAAIRAARLFERAVYRASRRLIAVTEAWVEQLVRRGVPRTKISLVTNGVDADFFDPAAARSGGEKLRSAWSLDRKTVIASVGTLSHVYDYGLILEAARRLDSRPEICFLIVGDGSQAAWLREQIARRGLANVRLEPAQPHARIRDVLAAADVSLTALLPLPVTLGQLPVRILEAMAMSLPVAFAGVGVARDVVAGSRAGLVAAPGDADALAEALDRLSAGPALRRELGANGRRAILDHFSRAAVAAQLEQALLAATRA